MATIRRETSRGEHDATIEQTVLNDEKAAKYINGKKVIKVIIVPKKIVNVVVK